jgi:hypothetical protein
MAPTKGRVLDHIAFSVPKLDAALARVKTGGYPVNSRGSSPRASALVMAPDKLQVELVEVKGQRAPVAMHHVHFNGPENIVMQTWYGTVLKVKPKAYTGQTVSFSVPGAQLEFTRTREEMAPTKGRVLDHIGFEVDNMDLFVDRLEDIGAPLSAPQRMPGLSYPAALLTDPWGTTIELTEGLDKIK